jgi:hypothetical protein
VPIPIMQVNKLQHPHSKAVTTVTIMAVFLLFIFLSPLAN